MEKQTMVFSDYIVRKSEELQLAGRKVTAGNYLKLLKSLKKYLGESLDRVLLSDIDLDFVAAYQRFLNNSGIEMATVSFYNRLFRSLYNQAVRESLVRNAHPFDDAYTKVVAPVRVPVVDVKGIQAKLAGLSKEETDRQYIKLMRKYNNLAKTVQRLDA